MRSAAAAALSGAMIPALVAGRDHGEADVASRIDSLETPDVRALAALVCAPSLISPAASPYALLDDAWRRASLMAQSAWLARLDRHAAPLHEHLARSNARQLGRYAEALWHFWFLHLPGAKVHAAGLAITEGHRVRGELDFVVTLPDLPGVQHLETGYKFFLHCPPGDDMSRFVGTHPDDRLDHKWRHMVDVQLPLSQTVLARAALPAEIRATTITPRACLQGHVFRCLHTDILDGPSREPLFWSRHGDPGLARGLQRMPAWMFLSRQRWIAPVPRYAHGSPAEVLTPAACGELLQAHFAHSRQARLVVGLHRAANGCWQEGMRIMVVAQDWPGATPAT